MIGILTCAFGRPQISVLYCLQIKRIRESYGDLFHPVVVVSTKEDEALFNGYGIETHMYANSPLGAKFQHGLEQLRDMDAVMLMGSDDLIDNTIIDKIISRSEEVVWPIGLYMANTKGGEIRLFDWFYKAYSSVGRLVRRSVLDRLDWKLWSGKELRAIDHSSHMRLLMGGPTMKMVPMLPDGVVMDIKSDMNINGYTRFSKGGKVVSDEIMQGFSVDEREYFRKLCQQ